MLPEIWFGQIAINRAAVHGVKALPPPPTTKVGITARGGFQAEIHCFLTGLDIPEKARMLESQLRKILAPYSNKFSLLSFSTLSTPEMDADSQNAATVLFRVFVQARKVEDLMPQNSYDQSSTTSCKAIQVQLSISTSASVSQNRSSSTTSRCCHNPKSNRRSTSLARSKTCDQPTKWGSKSHLHSSRKPSPIANPANPTQPTRSISPLPQLTIPPQPPPRSAPSFRARSGDKAPIATAASGSATATNTTGSALSSPSPPSSPFLGKEYYPQRVEGERFELPNVKAVNFLFRNLLDRGVGATASVDFLGKNVAEFLRARFVEVPDRFLSRGKL